MEFGHDRKDLIPGAAVESRTGDYLDGRVLCVWVGVQQFGAKEVTQQRVKVIRLTFSVQEAPLIGLLKHCVTSLSEEDGGEVFIDCRRKRELNQIPLELRFDLLVKLFGEVGVKRLRNLII